MLEQAHFSTDPVLTRGEPFLGSYNQLLQNDYSAVSKLVAILPLTQNQHMPVGYNEMVKKAQWKKQKHKTFSCFKDFLSFIEKRWDT